MLVFTSKLPTKNDPTFDNWIIVDRIIRANLTPEMKITWGKSGYDGLCSLVPEHFGMNRMYRNSESFVTFEFTEEQWAWFLLRWS